MSPPAGRNMLIGVDFDGTLTRGDVKFPGIGSDAGGCPWLNMVGGHPRVELVLWTMREGAPLAEAILWCGERGVEFTEVNGHEQNWATHEGIVPRKTFFDLLIDDAALGAYLTEPKDAVELDRAGTRLFVVQVNSQHIDWDEAGPALVRRVIDWMAQNG